MRRKTERSWRFDEGQALASQRMPELVAADEPEIVKIVTTTGVAPLDHALGGGLVSGLVEIFGEESVGKTGLVGNIIASAQRSGLEALMVVSEIFDAPYLAAMGVSLQQLGVLRAPTEIVGELCKEFLASESGRLIVIDSLSALQPSEPGFDAWNQCTYELLKQLKTVTPAWSLVVVVSQVRARRSMNPNRPIGHGTESQARWVSDLFDVRLEVHRENVRDDEYNMIVNIHDNPLAKPAVWVELPASKGGGVALGLAFFHTALELGIVEQRGSHYYLNPNCYLGQGAEEAAKTLFRDQRLRQIAESRMRSA